MNRTKILYSLPLSKYVLKDATSHWSIALSEWITTKFNDCLLTIHIMLSIKIYKHCDMKTNETCIIWFDPCVKLALRTAITLQLTLLYTDIVNGVYKYTICPHKTRVIWIVFHSTVIWTMSVCYVQLYTNMPSDLTMSPKHYTVNRSDSLSSPRLWLSHAIIFVFSTWNIQYTTSYLNLTLIKRALTP